MSEATRSRDNVSLLSGGLLQRVDLASTADVRRGVEYDFERLTGDLFVPATYTSACSHGEWTHRATILRNDASTTDDLGHDVDSWSTLASDVACRLKEGDGREIKSPEETTVADAVLYFPGARDIHERDRVTVGSRTYDVIVAIESADAGRVELTKCPLRVVVGV